MTNENGWLQPVFPISATERVPAGRDVAGPKLTSRTVETETREGAEHRFGTSQVNQISDALAGLTTAFNLSLKFSKDESSGTIVVQLVDTTTNTTLRQIPSEAQVKLAAVFRELGLHLMDYRG